MKPTLKLATISLMMIVFSTACTKKRPYEKVPSGGIEPVEKSIIDENALFIYTPSETESPRTVNATRPHWMGDEKLVKLQFKEHSLDVVEVEKDPRFTNNPTNNKPVLSIPVTHLAYRCAKNANDECSNKEEENNDLPWNLRPKFKMELSALQVQEVNMMPIAISNLFGNCYSEKASEVVNHELTNDVFNIEVEKTYESSINCVGSMLTSLSDLSFKSRSIFSIVKLDKLATADFKKKNYPQADTNDFGFFESEQFVLSGDNRDEPNGETRLIKHWNKNRGSIDYVMSDAFAKPENAAVKAATEKSIEVINDGLAKAGVSLKINLKNPDGSIPGDLRKNMIVLVEDPQATGIIGYGPSVANPLTGEIVNARVVMYLGTIVKYVRETYDDLVKEAKQGQAVNVSNPEVNALGIETARKTNLTLAPEIASKVLTALSGKKTKTLSLGNSGIALGDRQEEVKSSLLEIAKAKKIEDLKKSRGTVNPGATNLTQLQLNQIKSEIFNHKAHSTATTDMKSRIATLSKFCAYSADMLNFDSALIEGLGEITAGDLGLADLKPWAELSEDEQKKVIDVVVPFVWIPTLVHEIGHNLGLRHNFNGSEDKDNFFTDEERKELGLKRPVTYSSVMDYSYKTLNELRVLGKYDIAALRFGYNHEVEKNTLDATTGKPTTEILNIDKRVEELRGSNPVLTAEEKKGPTLAELKRRDKDIELKEFMFCTDEHADVNAGCNRFDEGTSLTEIATHLVSSYEDSYKKVNFRNTRRNFSIYSDSSYMERVEDTMYNLRLFLELYERITNSFDIPAELWQVVPFLKDLSLAVNIAGNFMLRTMITPEVHCAIALEKNPNQIVGVEALHSINSNSFSCFAPEILEIVEEVNANFRKAGKPTIKLVAQAGKTFRNKKSPTSENPYADQIDVRGVMIDKLLAAKYLLRRNLDVSLFDKFTDNFLNKDGFAQKTVSVLANTMLDSLQTQAPLVNEAGEVITDASGKVLLIPLQYGLSDSHNILAQEQMDEVKENLKLPGTDTTFGREILHTVGLEVPHLLHTELAGPFTDIFSVFVKSINEASKVGTMRKLIIRNRVFFATKGMALAQVIFNNIETVRILDQLDEETITKILEELKNPKPQPQPKSKSSVDGTEPSEEPDPAVIAQAKKLKPEMIQAYLDGELKSEGYYELVLNSMVHPE